MLKKNRQDLFYTSVERNADCSSQQQRSTLIL